MLLRTPDIDRPNTPPHAIGQGSSALQLSDTIAVAAVLAASGAMFAALQSTGMLGVAYPLVFVLSVGVLAVGELAIHRIGEVDRRVPTPQAC